MWSSRKYDYYRTSIGDPHLRPMEDPYGDQQSWWETLTCFIRDWHAPSKTDMSHWRLTWLIGDPSETDMPHQDQHTTWETDIPHWKPTWLCRPIGDQHVSGVQLEFKHIYLNILIFYLLFAYLNIYGNNLRTLIRHVGHWWGMSVTNEACQGLWSGMPVSNQVCRSPMSLK